MGFDEIWRDCYFGVNATACIFDILGTASDLVD